MLINTRQIICAEKVRAVPFLRTQERIQKQYIQKLSLALVSSHLATPRLLDVSWCVMVGIRGHFSGGTGQDMPGHAGFTLACTDHQAYGTDFDHVRPGHIQVVWYSLTCDIAGPTQSSLVARKANIEVFFNLSCKSLRLSQKLPFPEYPGWHVQLNIPIVSVQVASVWQLCIISQHSLTEEKAHFTHC